jgi:uncharacterized lipoprotein YajG
MKKLLVLLLLCGCATGKPSLSSATAAVIVATDSAYGFVVNACDEKEKQIVARPPTTKDKDIADVAHVRKICDKLFNAFENARTLAPLVKEFEAIK